MKKEKSHKEANEKTQQKIDDNLSQENTNMEMKAEKSSGENKINEETTQTESRIEKDTNEEQPEKTVETATTPDYEALVAEWKDKYLRLSAEFDNYRKRTLKEKIELTKYAGEEIFKSLLPVIDDFEHGLKNLEQANDINSVKEGIILIYNKFKDFIQQKGLKEIDANNCEFNTDFHEAVTKMSVPDKEMSGKVIDVIQKGYIMDGKVIRYSKVVVGE